MSRDREPDGRDRSRDTSLAAWYLRTALIALLVAAGFFTYFIMPKIEASWNSAGMRLPGWAIVLISTSHLIIKYWYVLLIGLATLVWRLRPYSGLPRK
jgi:type II secretory pathway component PulF